ncbi:hypothetical protein ACFL4N_02475 [Thermodesulfobacteriota bacterium]
MVIKKIPFANNPVKTFRKTLIHRLGIIRVVGFDRSHGWPVDPQVSAAALRQPESNTPPVPRNLL